MLLTFCCVRQSWSAQWRTFLDDVTYLRQCDNRDADEGPIPRSRGPGPHIKHSGPVIAGSRGENDRVRVSCAASRFG